MAPMMMHIYVNICNFTWSAISFLALACLSQVYNALGVSYVRDEKVDKGIAQFENAVKLQPGYVTAWNNLGDAYEKKKELKAALNAFEEVLLFDPNNKIARPRRDALKQQVAMYKDVPLKYKQKQKDLI